MLATDNRPNCTHTHTQQQRRVYRVYVDEFHGDARADCLAEVYAVLYARGRARLAARQSAAGQVKPEDHPAGGEP